MAAQKTAVKDDLFQSLYPRGFEPYRLKWYDIGIALAMFLIAFIVYVKTVSPSIIAGDSGELTTEIYQMGACHPPGYPLYGIIGKLFTFIPIGDIAFRVNIFAAFAGAGGVCLFFLIVLKLLGLNRDPKKMSLFLHLPALAATFLFAFGMTNWYCVINGKFYSLNTFLVTLMVYVMILWFEEMIYFRHEEHVHFSERLTILLMFCMGLSLTNHQLPVFYILAYMLVLLPVTIILVVSHRSSKFLEELKSRVSVLLVFLVFALIMVYLFYKHGYSNPRLMKEDIAPILTVLFLLPTTLALYSIGVKLMKLKKNWVDELLKVLAIGSWLAVFALTIYYYLVVRARALAPLQDFQKIQNWGDMQTLDILFNHVLRRQYGMGGSHEYNNFFGQLLAIGSLYLKQFHWINFIIAVPGLIYFFIRDKIWTIYTLLGIAALNLSLLVFTNFEVDPRMMGTMEPYFNQSYVFIALYVAFGYQLMMDLAGYLLNKNKAIAKVK